MKLQYVIKFVADMDRTVKFYRDVLGLPLEFQSPDWSEFVKDPSQGLSTVTAGAVLGFWLMSCRSQCSLIFF